MTSKKNTVPTFSVVEIEVNSHCNRRCVYCPVSLLLANKNPILMNVELFKKIITELEGIKYSGVLSYHLYNEPLLRHDIHKLISFTKSKIPNCFQLLYTNGDLLTNKKYETLISNGLNHILVTQHDNIYYIERERQTVHYSKDLILTNRGGAINSIIATHPLPLQYPCFAPYDNLVITVSGDVIICSEDANRSNIMGNLYNNSISEIWFSNKFARKRKLLEKGNRINASRICSLCNNTEYTIKGNNYHNNIIKNECRGD